MAVYTQGVPPIADPDFSATPKFLSFIYGLNKLAVIAQGELTVYKWDGSQWVRQ